jgi:hypothetical protein
MDENLYSPPQSHVGDFTPSDSISLYSPRQIYTGALVGGPLAGAWLISRNFTLLSKSSDCRKTLLVGLVAVAGLFPVLLILPKSFPPVVIPIAYSYPFYYFAERRFIASADSGVTLRKGWRTWLTVIGVGVAWLVLTVILWATASMLTAPPVIVLPK